ncbi:MAG: hypothetical protein ACP5NL_04290 [Thermoplasmata archaeon]
MSKVVFLIMSGSDSPPKAELGIISAVRSLKANRYEDLKVIFYGPSEEYITKLSGELADNVRYLIESKAVDSACVAIANKTGIDVKLKMMGVELSPFGERLAHYVNNGYIVISF